MAEEIYRRLAEKIFCKDSKLIPELFKMLADQVDASILLALPGTAQELEARTKVSAREIEQRLGQLFRKGVVFKSKKPEGVKYRMCRDLGQFHDASLVWPEAPPEFYELWQRYMEDEWPEYSKLVEKVLPKPFTRVIPIEKTVEARNQVLAFESVSEIIAQASRVAVTRCTCRTTAKKCDRPVHVCLQVGKAADYTLERGSGREVSKEEAMQIVAQAEAAGLVHVTVNKASEFTFICNCCECCCQVLPLLIKEGRKLCDPSRFQSKVLPEKCSGCGLCVDKCAFKAIVMVSSPAGEIAGVQADKCMGCGLCSLACPEDAIRLVQVREKEFIPA
jgi:Pyruvate/2-oxoacid:ferredoxin oxidoreductase delta subunit